MKKIFRLFLFFAVLNLVACSKTFLEKAPVSNANAENFFRSQQDFELAVNGAYASLRATGIFQDYMQLIGELRSDNATMGSTASTRVYFIEMNEFREQPASVIFQSVWNDHYAAIARCNIVTDRIAAVDFNTGMKERLVAEARFLRGLYYFNLVRVFGDVPLVLNEVTDIAAAYGMGRTPAAEVYAAIEEDLGFAAAHLEESYTGTNVGRATAGAAHGLLGKVLLTQKKYAPAAQELEKVVNSGKYRLLDNFGDLWSTLHKNSTESLFEVQFKKAAEANVGSSYSTRYTPYLAGMPLIGFETTAGGYNIPTEDITAAYTDNDERKYYSVAESYTNTNGSVVTGLSGRHTKKFLGRPTSGQGAEDNWPVLRYADVLLMYAEALNEQGFQPDGAAFDYLNEVRERAGLNPFSTTASDPEFRIADQRQFRLAVENERRLELAFEGHRWFDLVRTGRALEVLRAKGYDIQPHQLILPVPQEQIDVNPDVIHQNPDYN